MHLLREGQFAVADAFLADVAQQSSQPAEDADMMNPPYTLGDVLGLPSSESETLQEQFIDMYNILDRIRSKDLGPAVQWAQRNTDALNRRGSDLEFELAKLQFSHLLDLERQPQYSSAPSSIPTSENNRGSHNTVLATLFARETLSRFHPRYLHECQALLTALIFTPNLPSSPYRHLLPSINNSTSSDNDAWSHVALLFTREFCSLLNLSADSPLYLALTAGATALPRIQKLQSITKEKRTSWTTPHELPVEIPLPPSYRFHSIFVCPISKEQTTDSNPPMMMPCGHVIAEESLKEHAQGKKFKCMYCPSESHPREARKIVF